MRRWRRIGVLAAVLGLGVGELAAAGVRRDSSPVFAVADAVVDLTPRVVKDLTIQLFGPANKLVLLGGIAAALLALAAWTGVLASRRLLNGTLLIALLGAVGVLAAVTRPGAGALDALPSIAAAIASAAGLTGLITASGLSARAAAPQDGSVPQDGSAHRGDSGPPDGYDRRRLLVAGAVAGVGAVGAATLGRWLMSERFGASRSRAVVRIPAPASTAQPSPKDLSRGVADLSRFHTPNQEFYRVDTALAVPQLPAEEWRLRIHGMVERPLTIDYRQLLSRPLIERDITIACVSNPVGGPYVGNARWVGAPLRELLREVSVAAGADQVVSRSHDGMTIGTPTAALVDGRDAMLAVAMNGEPLPIKHGFPVRMVVPGLYGYVSACKWIVDMELTTFAAYDAYWIKQGWAEQAEVKTASRIDAPRDGATVRAGAVVIGGVAWAQHRGVERVEVRIDDGPWQAAELSREQSVDTWRQWVHRWTATPGDHRLRVRATDGLGERQTSARRDSFPDGATGWHEVTVTVEG
ncbi:MAG: molybdopterin-dependent oxidoreductase [Micromonosporaceae bacterium]|nr:molybdopterin-dependent oxidoreductase [Micromonosporaceae bacterium]